VGDWVLAVGNPLGYVSTVTAGIVSALGRDGPQDNISDFIQTDAAINQGNSGGALVNLKGEVIGINTWIATPSGSNAGLGFAIPINNAKKAIDDFINKGEIEYGWLGVSISDISKPVAQDLQVEGIKGAMIQNVYTDSPADKSGLLPGDYVTAIDGDPIESYLDLTRTVGDLLPNETYEFELIRYGKKVTLPVSIGLRENDESIAASYMDLWPGVSIAPLNDEIKKELELDDSVKGLLLLVNEKSKAQMAGLKSYDIVTAINDRKVETALDFYRELNSNDNRTTFTLLREGSVELEIGIRR
jgi:S1-C subfamily serine protease